MTVSWTEAVVNLLIALGVVGGIRIGGAVLWRRFRRGRAVEQQQAQLTAAERLQHISVELVEPLRQELEEARSECRHLRAEVEQARLEIDRANNNARAANRELDEARVEIAQLRQEAQRVNEELTRHQVPIQPIQIRRVQ